MAKIQQVLVLCLLIAAWSTEAAFMQKHALSQSKIASATETATTDDILTDDEDDDIDEAEAEAGQQESMDDASEDNAADAPATQSAVGESIHPTIKTAQPVKMATADSEDDDKTDAASEGDASEAPVYVAIAQPAVGKPVHPTIKPAQPIEMAASDDEDDDDDEEEEEDDNDESSAGRENTTQALAANQAKQAELEKSIAHYESQQEKDNNRSDDIEQYEDAVANETESPAMAKMLAGMWSEMRMFETPAHLEHLKGKLKKLKSEEAALKGEESTEKSKEKASKASKEKAKYYELEIRNKQHAFAVLLLLLTCTQIAVFAMVSGSNNVLKKNTWSMVNTMAVVVIASTSFAMISLFFEEMIEATHLAVIMHALYALILFSVALFGSYKLRNNKSLCDAFKAVIFWIVLLAKSGAIYEAQDKFGTGPRHATLINFSCALFLVLLMVVTHFVKMRYFADKEWYDDVEIGLIGGALGGGLAFLAHIWINHHFPPDPDPHAFSAQALENILAKDIWAAATCFAAVAFTTPISNMVTKAHTAGQYWYGRLLDLLNSIIGILPYFTVSLGAGDWLCHQMGFHEGSTGAHLISTGTSTFWGFAMILACSFIPVLRKQADADGFTLSQLMLGFGGYIAGYGWAALITESMGNLNDGWGWSESKKNMCTVLTVLGLNLLAVPVYIIYLNPVVTKASELKDDVK